MVGRYHHFGHPYGDFPALGFHLLEESRTELRTPSPQCLPRTSTAGGSMVVETDNQNPVEQGLEFEFVVTKEINNTFSNII